MKSQDLPDYIRTEWKGEGSCKIKFSILRKNILNKSDRKYESEVITKNSSESFLVKCHFSVLNIWEYDKYLDETNEVDCSETSLEYIPYSNDLDNLGKTLPDHIPIIGNGKLNEYINNQEDNNKYKENESIDSIPITQENNGIVIESNLINSDYIDLNDKNDQINDENNQLAIGITEYKNDYQNKDCSLNGDKFTKAKLDKKNNIVTTNLHEDNKGSKSTHIKNKKSKTKNNLLSGVAWALKHLEDKASTPTNVEGQIDNSNNFFNVGKDIKTSDFSKNKIHFEVLNEENDKEKLNFNYLNNPNSDNVATAQYYSFLCDMTIDLKNNTLLNKSFDLSSCEMVDGQSNKDEQLLENNFDQPSCTFLPELTNVQHKEINLYNNSEEQHKSLHFSTSHKNELSILNVNHESNSSPDDDALSNILNNVENDSHHQTPVKRFFDAPVVLSFLYDLTKVWMKKVPSFIYTTLNFITWILSVPLRAYFSKLPFLKRKSATEELVIKELQRIENLSIKKFKNKFGRLVRLLPKRSSAIEENKTTTYISKITLENNLERGIKDELISVSLQEVSGEEDSENCSKTLPGIYINWLTSQDLLWIIENERKSCDSDDESFVFNDYNSALLEDYSINAVSEIEPQVDDFHFHKMILEVIQNCNIRYLTPDSCAYEEVPSNIPSSVRNYWFQRNRLFLRYSEGILLDEESWYSVTPEMIASHQAERCTCNTVVDAFCGSGGNAIQLASTCNEVIAIDIDPKKLELARNNAKVYGVSDRIHFILGDFFQLAPTLKADVVLLSPPWGGMNYNRNEVYDVFQLNGDMDCRELMHAARRITNNIALYLPKSSNVFQVIELAEADGRVDLEYAHICNKRKGLTAYYADLVDYGPLIQETSLD